MLVEAQGFLIIIGNMGSGKTTLLQALAGLIPPFYRIVTIEDTPELRLPHNHWDSLVSRPRPPGGEIADIGLEELLKFALRRRAEYVIVGEVRGREARLLAQAAASGHGCMTTFHADSPEGAILRLRLDPISLPPLFVNVITAFVQVRRIPIRGGGALRRLINVTEVDGDELVETITWNPALDMHEPKTAEDIAEASVKLRSAWERLGMPGSDPAEELADRAAFLEDASRFSPDEFYKKLLEYYVSKYGEAGDTP
jgi:flagellar protein FlaI